MTSENLLVLGTRNTKKGIELAEWLAPYGLHLMTLADFPDAIEVEETGSTFAENAELKARASAEGAGLPALADDSGIEVDALDGAPGVHTADWAETAGGRDFMVAMTRTHDLLLEAGAPHPHTARFRATLVLAWPDGHDDVFEGQVDGHLVWPPRGREGHGYDPIFVPAGHARTFAEMSWSEKNRISHRARAIEAMVSRILD